MLRARGQCITRDRHLRYSDGSHHEGHSFRLEAGHQGACKADSDKSEVGDVDEIVFGSDESHGHVRPQQEESGSDTRANGQAIGQCAGYTRNQDISGSGTEKEDAHDEEISEGPDHIRAELHGDERDGEEAKRSDGDSK